MAQVVHIRFAANDNARVLGKRAFMPVSDSDALSRAAFERLSELMQDMGWNKTYTIKVFYKEVAEPLGQGDKAIRQWFDREAVPLVHIFNIGLVLGINPGWIGGLPTISKKDAIDEDGLYARVMAGRTPRAASNKK